MTLKEMPKVGDKVRYIGGEMYDVTIGKVYVVESHTERGGGFVIIKDDENDDNYIDESRFGFFEIAEETPQQVGVVRIEGFNAHISPGEVEYSINVTTDAAGYNALRRLEDASKAQAERRDIEHQIAQLQRKLEALK